MISVEGLLGALGTALVRPLVPGPAAEIADVVIAEPADRTGDLRGDLVFGVGFAAGQDAVDLVHRAADAGAAGVVLRRTVARSRGVRTAARRRGIALLELAESASLVHAIGLVRGVVDRAALPGTEAYDGTDAGGESDLLALADAAERLVEAPVTIEDAQSRVLAYSSRQDRADTARVSTIVGRRVPAALVAHLRSRGVFRRMARSDEPFLVLPVPGQDMPRYVVPVRAGGEWLGSIWAVVEEPPPDEVVAELRRAAGVVALHLLRRRAAADLTRRVAAERLRSVLSGGPELGTAASWLPPGPWRVAVVGDDADIWESRMRQQGWSQPTTTDLDGAAYVLVGAGPSSRGPGSWSWLQGLVAASGEQETPMWLCAGPLALEPADIPGSAHTAGEVAALRRQTDLRSPVLVAEDLWARLAVSRAAHTLGPADAWLGPLPLLRAHDERRRTAYLASLAAWLDHPGEPAAAARALGVHVNTLRHRMVRMSEVADLRLDDPAERLALRLQLAALGYG